MLKNYLKLDMRRAFKNWRFTTCILLVCLLMMYENHSPSVIFKISNNAFVPLMLVAMSVASIPFAASLVEDKSHKFNVQIRIRGDSKTSYISSRIFVVFLSAFVTFALGFILSVVIECFRKEMIDQDTFFSFSEYDFAYGSFIINKNYMIYVIAVTVHLASMAGLMSLIGIILGQLINNKMAVYCFPLVFVEVQDFLIQRIFGWEKGAGMTLKCLGINQISGILPSQGVGKYYFQVICYLIVICYFINYIDSRILNG